MPVDPDSARRRREAIERLGVLDRLADPVLTALTRVAATVTGVDSAAIHIVDDDYQYRVAAVNAPLERHPANEAMCPVVVNEYLRAILPDATQDPRFAFSPFVQGDSPVRFYAAVPLQTSDDDVIGTLCAFDGAAQELSDRQVQALEDLALQAITHMELTRIAIEFEERDEASS